MALVSRRAHTNQMLLPIQPGTQLRGDDNKRHDENAAQDRRQFRGVSLAASPRQHDRMSTQSKNEIARGEKYAEQHPLRYMDQIWDSYIKEFGHPST